MPEHNILSQGVKTALDNYFGDIVTKLTHDITMFNMNYVIDTSQRTENISCKRTTIKQKFFCQEFQDNEQYLLDFKQSFGEGYETNFQDSLVIDSVTYSPMEELPESPVEISWENGVSSGVSYAIVTTTYIQLPRKVAEVKIPDWLLKCVMDINVKITKIDQLQKLLSSRTGSHWLYDAYMSILSLFGWENLISSAWNNNDLPSEQRDYLPAIIAGADLGVDVYSILLAQLDIVEDALVDYVNTSRIKKIENILSQPKKLNIALGNAFNYGATRPTVYQDVDNYDYSKLFQITDDPDKNLFLSEQILNCLRYNFNIHD